MSCRITLVLVTQIKTPHLVNNRVRLPSSKRFFLTAQFAVFFTSFWLHIKLHRMEKENARVVFWGMNSINYWGTNNQFYLEDHKRENHVTKPGVFVRDERVTFCPANCESFQTDSGVRRDIIVGSFWKEKRWPTDNQWDFRKLGRVSYR